MVRTGAILSDSERMCFVQARFSVFMVCTSAVLSVCVFYGCDSQYNVASRCDTERMWSVQERF